MKRLAAIVLVFCSVFSLASAAETDDVMPLYDYISGISTTLVISDLGYAEATGTATVYPGYNVDVTVELQQFNNGWTTLSSYTGSGSGPTGAIVYVKRFVSHGLYQAKVTVKVKNSRGTIIETQTETSSVKSY